MPLIEYDDASPEVRAVYDDIMETRQVDWVNNFWKALAVDPVSLRRTWESVKEVMAPGALDPLTKELLYVAVSVTNGCEYCIASHTASARKKGMTDEQLAEVLAVVGMANETNALATGYGVPVDEPSAASRVPSGHVRGLTPGMSLLARLGEESLSAADVLGRLRPEFVRPGRFPQRSRATGVPSGHVRGQTQGVPPPAVAPPARSRECPAARVAVADSAAVPHFLRRQCQ